MIINRSSILIDCSSRMLIDNQRQRAKMDFRKFVQLRGRKFFHRNHTKFTMLDYEAVIGLEVHAQLKTATKAFCSCPTSYGAEPNSNTCPVCLGHPGALPVLNREVVDFAVLMGLATNSKIRSESTFARKNYFYPDLPKGYQISQFEDPVCYEGYLEVEVDTAQTKKIGITRIHIEEDAGKSIHDLPTA